MKLDNIAVIVIMIASLHLWENSKAETKAGKPRKNKDRLQCEILCEDCLTDSVPLKRMACFEECIAIDVDNFACPDNETFIGEVPPISPALEKEIQQWWKKRSEMFTQQDIDGIALTFAMNSVWVVDKQKPDIGRNNRKQRVADFFEANPDLGPIEFILDVCGEEDEIIWCNGRQNSYNKQGKIIATFDFMSLVTHVDGTELQEYAVVLFPESENPLEEVVEK